MKKFLIILLSLALFVFCVGCGTYVPPIEPGESNNDKPGGNTTVKPGDPENPEGPDDSEDDHLVFTVTLNTRDRDGNLVRYTPRKTDDIYAQWSSDGGSDIHKAKFDSSGVATCKGLDGEYRVTLSNLPSDRAYDPNGIYVDNDFRDTYIELLDVIGTKGTGKGLYVDEGTCIPINSVGTYKATVEKAYVGGQYNLYEQARDVKDGSVIYFQYTPVNTGHYEIESIVDVMDGKINPMLEYFNGSFAYSTYQGTYDGGGTEGDFTKNFKWSIECKQGEVGNVWKFAIKADVAPGVEWPVDIYFKLTYVGESAPLEIVQARGPFYTGPHPTGTFNWSFMDNMSGSRYNTAGDKVYALFWEDLDGDGLFTPAEWKDTNGNGKFDEGDAWRDTNGNGKYDEGEPYKDTNGNGKMDIGDEWWDYNGDGKCGLDTGDGYYHEYSLKDYPDGYSDATGTYPKGWGPILWTLIDGWDYIQHPQAQTVDDSGRPKIVDVSLLERVGNVNDKDYITKFMKTYKVYSQYVSVDNGTDKRSTGLHPVTKELMEALHEFAAALDYFRDGDGYAEAGPGHDSEGIPWGYDSKVRVDSDEDHMWLIFCGYFIPSEDTSAN